MDKALLARVEKQAWVHRYSSGLPILLGLLIALGTLLSVYAIERADAQRRQLVLERNFTEIASGLQRRAAENIAILNAGATLFSLREQVGHADFMEFASGLQSGMNHHGALGMAWAQWIPPNGSAEAEAAMRRAGNKDFVIFPRPEADAVSVPVTYIEPITPKNRNAVGFDMYSDPVRRQAMDQAIKLGQPVTSGRVHLAQDKGNPQKAGFLIYMPVFQDDGGSRLIKGFVYSPFRAEDFLNSIDIYGSRTVEVALYDGVRSPDNLLALRRLPGESGAFMERTMTVGHRKWTLLVTIKQPDALSDLSVATLLFGIIAALLVMLIARLIVKRAAEDRLVLEWLTSQAAIRTSLTRELNHRVKNTLANVLSIISLTRRRASSLNEFADSLTGRVRALSATHDILSQSDWSNAPISQVIGSELAPYMQRDGNHVEMSGPEISLAPNDALSLGLAIHELATNAAKYGALSTVEGKVKIEWMLLSPSAAQVHWREEGGPPVTPPSKRGFGSELIEKIVAQELNSEVELQFHPSGVECRLQVPVRKLTESFALRARKSDD